MIDLISIAGIFVLAIAAGFLGVGLCLVGFGACLVLLTLVLTYILEPLARLILGESNEGI